MNDYNTTIQTDFDEFEVSVVIPVYQAERFLRRAVESALAQLETREVILVEDGSTDDSLEVGKRLETENPERVRLVQHPDQGNHGAGASRNLGAKLAKSRFLAFLDADDYYMPGRFKKDTEVFHAHPDADGVYNALGTTIEDENGRQWYHKLGFSEITTLKTAVEPDRLFFVMNPIGDQGRFSFDALTLRRKAFNRSPRFEDLYIGEDTLLLVQMAFLLRLYPGSIHQPVALRGVHADNRVQDIAALKKGTLAMFEHLEKWLEAQSASKQHRRAVRLAHMSKVTQFKDFRRLATTFPSLLRLPRTWLTLVRWLLCRRYPTDPFLPGLRRSPTTRS